MLGNKKGLRVKNDVNVFYPRNPAMLECRKIQNGGQKTRRPKMDDISQKNEKNRMKESKIFHKKTM